MNKKFALVNEVWEGMLLFIVIALCASLYLCKSSYAAGPQNLNIDVEAEWKVIDFQRDPEPAQASTGDSLSQQYRLYLDGGIFKYGLLDSVFGVSMEDKYFDDDTDFENKLHFDYGRWISIDAENRQETDDEIFFSAAAEPQSPIHAITKKYDMRLAVSRASSIEYSVEDISRKDLLLGTVTNEDTNTQSVRFRTDRGPLTFSGEYRQIDFKDLLDQRSDIESRDLNCDVSYRLYDYFSISAFFEDSKDIDLDNNTQLHSQDSSVEFTIKPAKELKIRNRTNLRKDKDTGNNEEIVNKSNEIIVNFAPVKQVDLELAYKREDEDKDSASRNIDSTVDEERIRLRLNPYSGVDLQAGYEVTDKSSTSSTENLKDTNLYADVSCEPFQNIRVGGGFSNTIQKNTFTSATESDTKSISGSLQYRLKQKASLFMQVDSNKTDNPSTGTFTKTDTISSNFSIDPFPFLTTSLRTSLQETSGSSDSSDSERLLNSLELDIQLFNNLKLSCEYALVDSSGSSSSDENLFDIAGFYEVGRLDFSLRFQDKSVTGASLTDKTSILSDIKYKFSRDMVLSFRFSLVDYTDKQTASNSYDTTTIESILSTRF